MIDNPLPNQIMQEKQRDFENELLREQSVEWKELTCARARVAGRRRKEKNKKSEETKEDKNIVILAVISEIVTRIDHCICCAYG